MLYALTIFASAFLLFLVQPLVAKQILPWFGGTAAVWTVCLVFFQLLLLAGYTYADRLARLAMRRQAVVHTVLVLAACAMLPIIPDAAWKPDGPSDPTLRILALLAATIGLPYLAVCTTGPLVQSWFARVHAGDTVRQARVYRLFALSNLASLVALVAYPFALEPFATLQVQSWGWSGGFVLFAALVIGAAWATERRVRGYSTASAAAAMPAAAPHASDDSVLGERVASHVERLEVTRPCGARHLLWLALAALGTVMLLSVTTHITQDVASVPFLWIVPLALYLLTFILCFDSAFWYRRWIFWPAVIVLAPSMIWGLNAGIERLPIQWAIPLYAVGLFAVCMFCHGELVRAKPVPEFLTRFYLMISLGGAIGGLLVGVVAPRVFSGYWELPLALVAATVLVWVVARAHIQTGLVLFSVALLGGFGWFARAYAYLPENGLLGAWVVLGASIVLLVAARGRSAVAGAGLAGGLAAALCLYLGAMHLQHMRDSMVLTQRNFYGSLRVAHHGQSGSPFERMRLMHGVIAHGDQFTTRELHRRPTSYYGEFSGVGLAIDKVKSQPQRIGVIGLGTGTLAAYGSAGSAIRFYEINPAVVDIARRQFSYLADSASTVEIAVGDARLLLEREAATTGSQRFDVLVVDAFSSDSIPVHLMTREALAVYRRHMQPQGVIAFHISNRFLNLAPVVKQLADDAGMQAVHVRHDPPDSDYWLSSTDYVLVTNNTAFLADPDVSDAIEPIAPVPGLPLWTDDYNNLFKIIRTRH